MGKRRTPEEVAKIKAVADRFISEGDAIADSLERVVGWVVEIEKLQAGLPNLTRSESVRILGRYAIERLEAVSVRLANALAAMSR